MQSQNLVLLSHLSVQIIIIDLCYDNKCIKMPIELILTVPKNFDTTLKKTISEHWLIAIGEQICTYIFPRKHGQWALFLDRKRLILFKKDCTYDLHQTGILWLQRYLKSGLFVGRRFSQNGRLLSVWLNITSVSATRDAWYLKLCKHTLVNWSKMIIISDDIFSFEFEQRVKSEDPLLAT